MKKYLQDKDFLLELDNYPQQEKYARITSLTLEEKPLEALEGKVTGGSLNLDGASSLRRTCSLSLIAYDTNITDFYWGLANKFKLEIGVKNNINSKYPDIIWFDQGIYSITSFSSSQSGTNYSISISGKDKMCLLNGEMGGIFPFSVDLGIEEFVEKKLNEDGEADYTYRTEKMTLPYIITEMLHTYGGEPYHNIIINDLDKIALQLMEYRGNNPLYLITSYDYPDQKAVSVTSSQKCYPCTWDAEKQEYITDTVPITFGQYIEQEKNPKYFSDKAEKGKMFQLESYIYGDVIGYKTTNLVYPSDLIVNVGDTITSVLDKFISMLGNFEYFYDLQGRFIFQKKKIYIQNDWSPIITNEDQENSFYVVPTSESTEFAYSFKDNYLVQSISNSPKLDNIKNDFSIWGTKTSISGQELPVHMRYAIHSKPKQYSQVIIDQTEVNDYKLLYPEFTELQPQTEEITYIWDQEKFLSNIEEEKIRYVGDWREIIYHMAEDYNKYSHFDNFEDKIASKNFSLYPTGRTGYEQYYIDLLGFWRQLYYPNAIEDITKEWEKSFPNYNFDNKYDRIVAKYNLESTNHEAILKAIQQEFRTANSNEKQFYSLLLGYAEERKKAEETYYLNLKEIEKEPEKFGWTKTLNSPQQLNFWFDFLDPAGDLEKYSVPAIGSRPKAKTEKDAKALYFKEAPNLIFYFPGEENVLNNQKSGYTYIKLLDAMSNLISFSAQGKSAKNFLDEWMDEHLYGAESISIVGVPIYYLEPNRKIKVINEDINLSGEYIMTKISLPLTYNGTMNISAYKTIPMLY